MSHSDLWVLGTSCGEMCHRFSMYDPSASSSFKNTSTSFAIKYEQDGEGLGGYVATETVEMAGFSVASQGIGASAAADELDLTSREL